MPISGVVVTTRPEDLSPASLFLASCPGVEVHGADDKGNLVVVLETSSGEEMEHLLNTVNAHPLVLHAGVTYLNMEDMLEGGGMASETTL